MKDDIRDYLAQFRGQEVSYFPNPGNAGDSVIACGTYHALDRTGLTYTLPHHGRFDPAGKTIFYGGGGNLVGPATFSARAIRKWHRTAKHLCVLPQTIKDVDGLLSELGPNVTLICRERVSYDHVRSLGGRYETLLMDDMAFSLDVEQLMSGPDRFNGPAILADFVVQKLLRRRAHTTFDNVRRYLNPGKVAASLRVRPAGGVLNAFRLDGEATDIAIPADNVDLSAVFMFGVGPVPVAEHAARSLIGTLMKFDEIRTNRLHVGISAALAGKRTLLYANNYYKIRAIYDFSMRGRYPHVTWMG